MSQQAEPEFLTREIVDAIHEEQIGTFGGLHGVRDENGLESAIASALNVYHYGGGYVFDVAAAYAYHIAQSQAYFDGNKRTGLQAALVFLEGSGIDCGQLLEEQTYDAMIQIANHKMKRIGLAAFFRSTLGRRWSEILGVKRRRIA